MRTGWVKRQPWMGTRLVGVAKKGKEAIECFKSLISQKALSPCWLIWAEFLWGRLSFRNVWFAVKRRFWVVSGFREISPGDGMSVVITFISFGENQIPHSPSSHGLPGNAGYLIKFTFHQLLGCNCWKGRETRPGNNYKWLYAKSCRVLYYSLARAGVLRSSSTKLLGSTFLQLILKLKEAYILMGMHNIIQKSAFSTKA